MFVAAGDRLLIDLNSSHSAARPGDTRASTNCFNVLLEDLGEIHFFPETLEFETWPDVRNFRSGE